jgi:hypothetical protein
MSILSTILAIGLTVNMGTVFAGGDDESYSVQQKVDIEQDCDQKNENEDSAFSALTNAQECTAIAANVNDLEIIIPVF